MSDHHDIDPHTGTATTGHEWDGIKELNTPLPKWWLFIFWACIIWAIGYWYVFPSWPLLGSQGAIDWTQGTSQYSQRSSVTAAVAELRKAQVPFTEAISKASLAEIKADPKLLSFAMQSGKINFANNCAPCHGRGAQGSLGFPNLNDDKWLWGGTLEDISTTITHGIRATDDAQTRQSQMPKFGLDKMLTPEQINDTAEYVLQISGQKFAADAAARGKTVFAENCAVCHGEKGDGNKDLGAPSLVDNNWLYGGTKEAIVTQINIGRGGVMPAWGAKLSPEVIKEVAVYVHSLGGGK